MRLIIRQTVWRSVKRGLLHHNITTSWCFIYTHAAANDTVLTQQPLIKGCGLCQIAWKTQGLKDVWHRQKESQRMVVRFQYIIWPQKTPIWFALFKKCHICPALLLHLLCLHNLMWYFYVYLGFQQQNVLQYCNAIPPVT